MDVAGNQLGGGWATYLGGKQEGAIREQVGARDDPVVLRARYAEERAKRS